jgi:hypothetical protein
MEELGIYIKERGRHQGIESIYVNIYIYIYINSSRETVIWLREREISIVIICFYANY